MIHHANLRKRKFTRVITFPEYNFSIKAENGRQFIFDIIRKKYIKITPEEWVRQHIIHFLVNDRAFPKGLISIEKQHILNDLGKRTDLVLYNKAGKAVMLVECKSPEIALSQKTFEQAARYNLTLKVPYLWITNGKKHMVSHIDHNNQRFEMLTEIPSTAELIKDADI